MRILLQRVRNGAVHVNGTTIGAIEQGIVALVGFGPNDTLELPTSKIWDTMLKKLVELRIFPDVNGKLNLSVSDFGADLLLVPQFTLYADCRKGRRPSFHMACAPETASQLFDACVSHVRERFSGTVATGQFGADMNVELTNWGPITIMLDSDGMGK